MPGKSILIVSYVFPPHPGIGGRRWAKFAKYLSRQGYVVHVVYAKNPNGTVSAWINDINGNSNIFLHPVNSFFPKAFTHQPRHWVDRLIYKFWKLIAGLMISGYIYDKTAFSGKKFVRKAEKIINDHNIQNVIVTGAPFRLVYLITKAKKNWAHVKVHADFRDPWTWEEGGDYQKLPANALDREQKNERYVMENANFISAPTDNMINHLKNQYKQYSQKLILLPHAWDEDEIVKEPKMRNAVIKLVLFGTLYGGIEEEMKRLALALKSTKGKIHLDIISDSKKYRNVFEDCNALSCVTYFPSIASTELYRKMKHYCASVIINNYSDKDHVSTKFIELAASGTPIIYIAPEGAAGAYVRKKKIGWHISIDRIDELFASIIANKCTSLQVLPELNALTFKNVTADLIKKTLEETKIPSLSGEVMVNA